MRRTLAACLALAGLGAALAYGALRTYTLPGPLDRGLDVMVPRGGSAAVARALQSAGVLDGTSAFRLFAAATSWQGPLRSAELAFPAHASLAQVLAILRNGMPVQHRLTIPEGLTAAHVAGLIAQASGLTGEIVVPDEGTVLPETYAYVSGASGQDVLSRAERAMDRTLALAWVSRSGELPLRSPRELLILASLIERETHLPGERRLVASVFLNRLSRGMRLQSDPTVIYGESGGGGELGHGLSRAALARPTPYNSYAQGGLPAGPICAPGAASIEAAAHPSSSEALYFVADGKGGHLFADSLDEHARNVRLYRRLPH